MIEHIHIEGFRSFEELDLDLGPLNVLIGPNASGKSNFLDFFALLREGAEGRLQGGVTRRGGIAALLWWGGAGRIDIEATFGHLPSAPPGIHGRCPDTLTYRLQVEPEQYGAVTLREWARGMTDGEGGEARPPGVAVRVFRVKRSDEPLAEAVREQLDSCATYVPIDTAGQAPIRHPVEPDATTQLRGHGGNLTAVLHYLSRRHEYQSTYSRICEAVSAAYPDFEGMTFRRERRGGRVELEWRDKSLPKHVSARFLSDGTLRLLCLVTVLLAPDPPALICIDLPEEGLHPSLMPLIADLLHDAATRTQLIVATHSAQLVDHLQPEEVIVVEKEQGATQMMRLEDRERLEEWLKDFTLGELWLTGEIGGRP
ncbi:MAG: AAA family ATPase [Armatimonadota bacterium]